MARPRNPEPYVQWKISVPATLAAEIELEFWDPVLGKPKYGDRSDLLVQLLRSWLEVKRGSGQQSLIPSHAGAS